MSDKEFLIELFRCTKGKYWTRKDHWDSEETCRKWFGITVNSSGHISVINLRRNYLQDKIESIDLWRMLSNIQVLCLSDNKLNGKIPVHIGDMHSLEELDLSWNELDGPIPATFFRLVNLRVLRLEHNHLCGEISCEFRNFQQLRFLNLSMNNFEGKLPKIGHLLPELKILDLSRNNFEGFVPSLVKEFVSYSISEEDTEEMPPEQSTIVEKA